MKKLVAMITVGCAAVLSACATNAPSVTPNKAPMPSTAQFTCQSGHVATVHYVNTDRIELDFAGNKATLDNAVAASGARYVNNAQGVEWHEKGNTGILTAKLQNGKVFETICNK